MGWNVSQAGKHCKSVAINLFVSRAARNCAPRSNTIRCNHIALGSEASTGFAFLPVDPARESKSSKAADPKGRNNRSAIISDRVSITLNFKMPANPLDSVIKTAPREPGGPVSGSAPAVQQWRVGAEYAGQRIDNFLLARLKGVPKTRIYRMLRTGEVRVNGGRVASDYRIQEDDRLRIPPIRVAEGVAADGSAQSTGRATPAMARAVAEKIRTIYEDEVMLAIDKPFGLAVHGGSGVKLGVIEALRVVTNPPFLELVHRLDRETSGLMLLAKRRLSLTEFHRQLREGEMRKRYLALVWGGWPAACDRIEAPLHKWVNAKGERWVRVQADGQAAITKVKVLQRLHHARLGEVTLLQCEPLTGRTHQLRVHLASQGHPIVGDPKYGLHERDGQHGPKGSGLVTRMYLHAWMLRLKHPVSGETMHLKAEPDSAFRSVLEQLGAKAL